ncbi:MAG TPA: UvrD-helicase domain-containing protein [Candidatus Cybelea sp.]|nr:UvrD-helicase domain-containing protein [Candidatus Cybelea sp.]
MIALELTKEQRAAVEAPYDGSLAILGAAGTGKSTVLAERANRARALHPQAQPLDFRSHYVLDEFAVALLRESGREITLVDDVEAELLFARACTPLFNLQWAEFADEQLDPEVPGLRSPQRFLAAAFRLIRRLGDANVDPALFLSLALTGATEFYANPPNFADPSLLIATKNTFHDSLDVNPQELGRQYRREVDLAKIVAKLYEHYVQLVNATGRMTGRDAVVAATRALREDRNLAAQVRERHRLAFVDDAQELTDAQVQLLCAIFGEALAGVTLCGDPASAVSIVRRTQPELTFAQCSSRIKLRVQHRMPSVDVYRPKTAFEEAAFVAERVSEWIAQGVSAPRIAIIFRSVHDVEIYERALLDANVAVAISGDVNLFADRRARDALALLWNVYDPFRHEWLLRTLSGPAVGLSDASLATLCGEPLDPQRPLFAFDDEPAPTTRASRWNPKRDLRLGWNVVRGEQDDALGADAAARVKRFRRLREQWIEVMQEEPFEAFARRVWREGLARDGELGSARALAQQAVLRRLLDRLRAFLAEKPDATTAEILEYAQRRMESDLETCEPPGNSSGFVQMMSVEAAQGREFEYAIVANVRPGAFPLWYAPDAFLFSPKLGMIPKENAGDAQAARTAKFSYYMFRTKAAQRYNERERRALHYALRRTSRSVLVTAWGSPTRGITAPELLEELR